MEKEAIRLFALDAAILMLRNLTPDETVLRNWNRNRIKTALLEQKEKVDETGDSGNRDYKNGNLAVHKKLENGKAGREGNIQLQRQIDTVLDELDVSPGKAILIADDPNYLNLARKKKLAMRIAVAPGKQQKQYYQKGADLVINSLDEMSMSGGGKIDPRFIQSLPNIFSDLTKFHSFLNGRKPVFFFDYDGTLTQIVNDPAKALIHNNMRDLLKNLSEIYSVAVISGRDMNDIRSFIGLDNIIYAGSHGFRIKGPDNMFMENKEAMSLLAGLDSLEEIVKTDLEMCIEGVEVERKQYAIAIHYRNAATGAYKEIKNQLSKTLLQYPDFKIGRGKKIYEIRPAIDWHKGKAMEWILRELDLDPNTYCPVYLGDDITDEDAFRYLVDDGLGILVGDHGQPTAARYRLENVDQVRQFLHFLLITTTQFA